MTTLKDKQKRRIAQVISNILNPAVLVVVSIFLILKGNVSSPANLWIRAISGMLLIIGPAFVYTFYLWTRKKQFDPDITHRQDRIVPLLLSTLGALIGSYLLETRTNPNHTLVIASRSLVAMLLVITIITLVWKVSLHMATISALVTLLVLIAGNIFALLYLLLIPVGWARLQLKQHTPTQIIAGTILGVVITFAVVTVLRS